MKQCRARFFFSFLKSFFSLFYFFKLISNRFFLFLSLPTTPPSLLVFLKWTSNCYCSASASVYFSQSETFLRSFYGLLYIDDVVVGLTFSCDVKKTKSLERERNDRCCVTQRPVTCYTAQRVSFIYRALLCTGWKEKVLPSQAVSLLFSLFSTRFFFFLFFIISSYVKDLFFGPRLMFITLDSLYIKIKVHTELNWEREREKIKTTCHIHCSGGVYQEPVNESI